MGIKFVYVELAFDSPSSSLDVVEGGARGFLEQEKGQFAHGVWVRFP